jgi:hypothetical protein
MRTRFHLPRNNPINFHSKSLGKGLCQQRDRKSSADVRWNALMSGLSVLTVLGSLPDMFKMFNSIIGPFHHVPTLSCVRPWLG